MQRWLVIAMVFGLTACGALKVRDVNEAEMSNVKKVAIASFSMELPPRGQSGPTQFGGTAESEDAGAALRDVSAVLGKKMGWKMQDPDQMRANAEYKKMFEAKMKGWQGGKVLTPGKLLYPPGIMDAQSLRRMKPAERDSLMAALGVDAIIEADVHITFAAKGVKVMGIGSRYPQATSSVWMYKRGVEKPVWFDGRLVGEAASESVGATGFYDDQDVVRLGRASVKNAFENANMKQQ